MDSAICNRAIRAIRAIAALLTKHSLPRNTDKKAEKADNVLRFSATGKVLWKTTRLVTKAKGPKHLA
jgi:hypothetical protein